MKAVFAKPWVQAEVTHIRELVRNLPNGRSQYVKTKWTARELPRYLHKLKDDAGYTGYFKCASIPAVFGSSA